MSAEVKKSASGVYLLFVGEQVTEEDLSATVQRYYADAAASDVTSYVVVVEPIRLANPLQVARWLAKHTESGTSHYVVVGNGRDSMVFAERLGKKLSQIPVELEAHQQAAVDRAKAIIGADDEADFPACNYL